MQQGIGVMFLALGIAIIIGSIIIWRELRLSNISPRELLKEFLELFKPDR